MKKILIVGTAIVAGLSFGLSHAADDAEKGKGKGKGKGGDPSERADALIKKCDKDGNGTLSKEEFAASPMGERMKDKEGALDKMFAGRDKNKDGELDKAELSAPPKGGKGKGAKKGDGEKKAAE